MIDRIKELIKTLNSASKAYYQEDREIMSDFQYDKLYDELIMLEKKTGIIFSDSPSQKVGYEVLSGLKKVTHDSKMLSLDKTKDVDKLKSFLDDKKGILSLKMDGLTIVLKYYEGKLVQAITRGNGEVGEDITHNAKVFKNIPIEIKYKGQLTVRGEAVISFKDFEKINEKLEEKEKYKNPRNLCSGTVRQLNNEIAANRNIYFTAFSLVNADDVDFKDSKTNMMKWLNDMGFSVVDFKITKSSQIENDVKDFQNSIPNNEFASDGLVLTYDSISYSKSLGSTSKFPKDSIAFKWADETAETILKDIVWNTSRTGLINPIAIFEPVELEGTTVNRASLHNLSIVQNFKLGIGDKITVYKANMIIPQIAENLTRSNTFIIPDKCSVCGGNTEIIELKDGKALKCTNPNCKAQLVMAISHYASRDALNIEGLSEASIEKFVDMKFIKNYTDIYEIHRFKDNIINMEGFGERLYNKIYNAIEKSKDTYLFNFIYGLGINHVGLNNAKILCKNFDNNIDKIINASEEELNVIDGFGKIISYSIFSYFNNDYNIKLIKKAMSFLRLIKANNEYSETSSEIKGMSFVITGDVLLFKNRKELKTEIEKLGGNVTENISKKTSYLINNNIDSKSTKNKLAKEKGISIISEKEFVDMFLKNRK